MKSRRITRIVQILTTLQAGEKYTADGLSKLFDTSRRTIFRDLKELKLVGIPYHFDSKTGFYTIGKEFFLPPIDLNLTEALSLLLLVHKFRGQIQMPFKRSALLGALKIENNLPAKIRQSCDTALKRMSAITASQSPTEHLDNIFSQLHKAITKKRRVSLLYHSLFERQTIETELCPYHIMYNRRAWYVIGFSHLHKSIRTFKLNRIRKLDLLNRRFIEGDKFDLYEYLSRAWAMIPEGRIYNVKLRFLPKVAENVAEVQWHNTQKTTRNSDGSAIMEFRVDGLGEISWWILGYGDQVQVLAPKILREKIIDTAKNMIVINEKI